MAQVEEKLDDSAEQHPAQCVEKGIVAFHLADRLPDFSGGATGDGASASSIRHSAIVPWRHWPIRSESSRRRAIKSAIFASIVSR